MSKNIGICAIECYFPSTYISQEALEKHNGVSSGKYTIGLGQEGLAVTGDAEDINSIALTVTQSLLEKYEISPQEVGRLEVGTETLVDKSKSTKTVLMDLFTPHKNTDIEGATIVNACYGGTAALLNAFAWVESDGWDGRYAIVVAADIATYARGPARPTCGVGAVAVLVGRDAVLCHHPAQRATHASHVWDFFKPDHTVEYPVVDGALSQVCYYEALQDCYTRFADKMDKMNATKFTADDPDYFVFHAPYNKLVQKSHARLYLLDARREHARKVAAGEEKEDVKDEELCNPLSAWVGKKLEDTYADRELDSVLKKLAAPAFKEKLTDANSLSKQIGNTYTASVFMGLASLINNAPLKTGNNVCVFSYGSGALATMYNLTVHEPSNTRFSVNKMVTALSVTQRLESREEVNASELDLALETRARMHRAGAPYSPVYPPCRLFPGTYYLNGIDSKWRRTYTRLPLDHTIDKESRESLAPPIVRRLAKQDEVSKPVTGMLSVLANTTGAEATPSDRIAEANRRIACVITGVSAGLPAGKNNYAVFRPDNLNRLIEGDQCIVNLTDETKNAMLEKNIVQLKKHADGTITKIPVSNKEDVIQLAAQIGELDLVNSYGLPAGLVQTMDLAAQLAVAAGLEALKDAGLVTGNSNKPHEWILPEKYQETTGVVYASSFPAMDAAVGEVMRFLESKTVNATSMEALVHFLRERLAQSSPDGKLEPDDQKSFDRLLTSISSKNDDDVVNEKKAYVFDRKFLFRVLVLGNAQLAQLAKCKGPNTQTNAACAGTTQAIAMAQDMLISGRAQRVVVVAGDNASGETLIPWLGSGFRALGAATIKGIVEEAALPFDRRRSGMLLGAGGIGMVLETEESANLRNLTTITTSTHDNGGGCIKARLLATQYSNSAFHGAALDRKHIGSELTRFLRDIEQIHGISKAEIATHGVYFSHETCTHASDAASCSGNESAALRDAFGDDLLSKMMILNTKGFTGHPMGVSFEDVAAIQVLLTQTIPPISNYREFDPYLGNLKLSKGGKYACRYALRFAAGFGSQVAFALYSTV